MEVDEAPFASTIYTHSIRPLELEIFLLLSSPHVFLLSRLWESFKESLSEDLLLAARRREPSVEISFTEDIFNEALILLENKCLGLIGKRLKELGLPEPKRSLDRIPREILAQTNFDFDELQAYVDENEPKLTEELRLIYEYCLDKEGGITNIDGTLLLVEQAKHSSSSSCWLN